MTSRRLHIALLALAGLGLVQAGCNRRPSEVLSEKKMTALLTDMQVAEAYADIDMHGGDAETRKLDLGNSILAAHGVTREQLDTTLAWYGRNMDDYAKMLEKVDRNLNERRSAVMAREGIAESVQSADMLWPGGNHGTVSRLGTSDGWVFSLPDPSIEKGDVLTWKMRLSKNVVTSGVLGVEYEDGSAEAVTTSSSPRQKVEMTLLTDTGKTVKRVYGTLRLRNRNDAPLYADSIMLHRAPYDSLEYSRYRNQKRYGVPVARSSEVTKEKKDTVTADTAALAAGTPPLEPNVSPKPLRELPHNERLKPRTVEDARKATETAGTKKAVRRKPPELQKRRR